MGKDDTRVSRDRKRSPSDSGSDSDASSERRHRRREKSSKRAKKDDHNHKKKKKKKTKKSKKPSSRERETTTHKTRKRSRRRSRSSSESDSSSSDSEIERGTVDLERAADAVRALLVEFPTISSDLVALLQMLDDGETAVISGIANARVKTLLRDLLPLLGLRKLKTPEDAFVARRGRGERPRLLETVATMLTAPATDAKDASGEVAVAKAPEPKRREAPIGPMMPPSVPVPSDEMETKDARDGDDDDDDDVVGPALPGMKGYRAADERVEAEMARRAMQLQEDEWRRARGEAPVAEAATGGREAWMTEMPTNSKIFDDAMGPMKPRTGQPAAFRSKEPAKIDSTWFDSPEERERGKRAKLDMELLGYVRPENAPTRRSADQAPRLPSNGPGVNESILPAANPEADEDMRRQMDALKQKRGPSLLEQHQKKVADEQKSRKDGDSATERSTWNRDRDLTARRGLSQSDADRIIKASQEISSKFTAPTVTRQFL